MRMTFSLNKIHAWTYSSLCLSVCLPVSNWLHLCVWIYVCLHKWIHSYEVNFIIGVVIQNQPSQSRFEITSVQINGGMYASSGGSFAQHVTIARYEGQVQTFWTSSSVWMQFSSVNIIFVRMLPFLPEKFETSTDSFVAKLQWELIIVRIGNNFAPVSGEIDDQHLINACSITWHYEQLLIFEPGLPVCFHLM